MESLRDIKRQIKAINSTKQMMLTMKIVSSARIRKAQNQMLDGRPFSQKMAVMIDNMRKDILDPNGPIRNSHFYRFFDNSVADKNKVALLLITGDKGLCGAFNAITIRESLKWIKENYDKEKFIFVVGKKGADFLRRLHIPKLNICAEITNIFPHVSYIHAKIILENFVKLLTEHDVYKFDLIYNDFKSLASQRLVSKTFLPFSFDEIKGEQDLSGFTFEPNMYSLFETLLPRYVATNIYRFLLESQAAELAARMNAMEAASKNAGDIADALSVKLNKVRQEGITNELTEIVSGANALSN